MQGVSPTVALKKDRPVKKFFGSRVGGGLDELQDDPLPHDNGTVVQKVRTTYAKGAGDAGGMHTWTYLIDPKTGRLAANHLEFVPGKFDWTEYYDEKPVGQLLLSVRRVGYIRDAKGKVGPKQSEITYDQSRPTWTILWIISSRRASPARPEGAFPPPIGLFDRLFQYRVKLSEKRS